MERSAQKVQAPDVVARSVFSTDRYDRRHRFEAARAYTTPFFELTPDPTGAAGIYAHSISHLVHDLVLNETKYGPMGLERPDRRHLTTDHEFVTLWLVLEGRQDGIVEDAVFRTRAGELHLFDSAPAMRLLSNGPHVLSAHIPYAAIGFDPSRHPPHMQIPTDSATWHVVAATLRALHDQAPAITVGEAPELARGFCSLLRAALRLDAPGSPDPQLANRGRALAMRAFLDGRLHDRNVDVDTLCRKFGVSRATVYRLFSEHGGVEAYLRRRRLERAFSDLAAATPRRGLIRRVAERWGFDDASHFHRRFRDHYGMSPIEAAQLGGTQRERGRGAAEISVKPVFDWLTGPRSSAD